MSENFSKVTTQSTGCLAGIEFSFDYDFPAYDV
jgi:hypothetical protein